MKNIFIYLKYLKMWFYLVSLEWFFLSISSSVNFIYHRMYLKLFFSFFTSCRRSLCYLHKSKKTKALFSLSLWVSFTWSEFWPCLFLISIQLNRTRKSTSDQNIKKMNTVKYGLVNETKHSTSKKGIVSFKFQWHG